ncbi:MAG: hypothetical protein GC153_00265 [Alphaproteobacteria bacterium]|nr:hypothetical protein [Alphaproteobacteria bacterium]
MKAFEISEDQIARVIAGLIADELSWRFKRHTDFLTLASWTADAPIESGGIGLGAEERAACARRCARFFGIDAASLGAAPASRIADWAALISREIRRSLRSFSFTAAGRDSATESVSHAAADIFGDAAAAANILYGRRRLISLVAPHGLVAFEVTVLTPNLQHIPVIDARGMAPDALAKTLAFGDVVVATPTLWRYMIREGVTAPNNAMGVLFGEAMTPDLAAELRKAGFGTLRELYGSTETGLVGWRDSSTEPFMLFDHWRREGESLARRTPGGDTRLFTPMDALQWTSDTAFRLGARRDGAVQVGAVNVFPGRIAAVIKQHRAVDDCRVRVMRRDGGLNRLVARIVLNPEVAPTEQTARDIDAWCRRELRPEERPRIYNFELSLDGE